MGLRGALRLTVRDDEGGLEAPQELVHTPVARQAATWHSPRGHEKRSLRPSPRATDDGNIMLTTERFAGTVELTLPSEK